MAFIQIVQIVASMYVMGVGLLALNRMSHSTRHAVRWAYVALVAGAASSVASCFVARDVFECIFTVGVALFMAFNQRTGAAHA